MLCALYLCDSIVKNVGEPYVELFSRDIAEVGFLYRSSAPCWLGGSLLTLTSMSLVTCFDLCCTRLSWRHVLPVPSDLAAVGIAAVCILSAPLFILARDLRVVCCHGFRVCHADLQ